MGLSYKELAIKTLLSEENVPLRVSEIWEIAEKKRYDKQLDSISQDPVKSLWVALDQSVGNGEGIFVCSGYPKKYRVSKKCEKEKEQKREELSTREVEKGREFTRKPIPKDVRNNLWRMYWDSLEGKCWVCGTRTIAIDDFDCGHIVSVSNGGGDDVGNLIPICRGCNQAMKKENIFDYKERHYPNVVVNSKFQPKRPDINVKDNSKNSKDTRNNIESQGLSEEVPEIYYPLPIMINPGDIITSFNFNGNKYNVSTWKELLLEIIGYILHSHKREFDKILDVKGSQGRIYFWKKPNKLIKPEKIEGADIYVETNLSAKNIVELCYYMIRRFGYIDTDLKIRYH